ncbi:MAG: flagellar basal body L-ring protein FlgH [Alphaproteobacteria bacterium]
MIRMSFRLLALGLVATTLTACNTAQRLSEVGQEPELARIENPRARQDYQPVSLPLPAPEVEEFSSNSLWRSGARSFFKDQRAKRVGDLLTVEIAIADEASLNNTSTRARDNSEDAQLPAFGGIENQLGRFLPEGFDPSNMIDFSSGTSNRGTGTIDRSEEINLRVAALITQVMPNGNLVIHGKQQVRVNYEMRELQVMGVIRPEDITAGNTIPYDKIAEARIAYGGRGHISDVQQPRYGQQVFDVLFPF